jgi:cellulose synthase/poly-beta-1,6-N-acetylglucosamine synthase-like glycosyltransferase
MPTDRVLTVLWVLVLIHIVITWLLAIRRGLRARHSDVENFYPLPENPPPISIIVPAWNEIDTLDKCLAALRQVNYPNWEAVIVAGGEDGTYPAAVEAAAEDKRFHVIERDNPDPKNAALTRGIQAAQHNILVLLDADIIVEPGWLLALVAPIANGASVTVGHTCPNRWTWVTLEEHMCNIRIYKIRKRSWIQGDRSIAIRREVLERIGGLPLHTYAREDWDVGVRLEQSGEQIVYSAEARIVTDRPSTLKESWRHHVRWHRTHLAGLWEYRSSMLKKPFYWFNQIYLYLITIALSFSTFSALVLLPFRPTLSLFIFKMLALFAVWQSVRIAAIAGEVAAYTGDWHWLPRAWMSAINIFMIMAASLVAMLTPGEQNPFYKGPRHEGSI